VFSLKIVRRIEICDKPELSRTPAQPLQYHAVADQGILFQEIVSVIGRRLNVPVVSKTPEEAKQHFGWFAQFAAVDLPASSHGAPPVLIRTTL
jgi:hypothetical protein